MKLKLKNPDAPAGDAPAGDAPAVPPVEADASAAPKPGGLKLKLKPSSTTASPATADSATGQAGDVPKPKRKYTKKAKFDESGNPIPPSKPGPKKRAREDGDDVETPATKRKPKPTAKSLAMANDSEDDDDLLAPEPVPAPSRPQPARTQSIKLSIKPKNAGSTAAPPRTGTAILKVKGMGKAPVRPYGVGYDSEAEEAEKDPAIESQFVLRMLPGPDCDLLRKSIEEKTIGKSMAQGGPGVYFRFFDREGRRAMLTIQGRMYAASMVELPTVIESLKSWNKKDWVKTADVCQMLLVLGRVQSEEEAKKFPRPSYVEPDSHRFPHGLTPPMQWARKRRFRPRRSYLDVERAEAHMNRLLVEDENAIDSKYDLVDSDEETAGESDSEEESDGDEDMMDTQQGGEQHIEEVDAGDLEQMLAEGFMEDEVELQVDVNDLFGQSNGGAEPATPATAHDVALHALQQSGAIALETETAASTPAAATSADDDDDDDDDDADSDDEANGVDDAAEAEEQRKEQLRGEIAELEKAVQSHVDARNAATNKIFKTRKQKEIDKLQADLDIKRRQLGEDLDE